MKNLYQTAFSRRGDGIVLPQFTFILGRQLATIQVQRGCRAGLRSDKAKESIMVQVSWLASAAVVATLLFSRVAVAQPAVKEIAQTTVRPYDGIQAGYDAYQLGEEKRQRSAGQQIYLNDRMRALATPLATYGYGYGPYLGTFGAIPASGEYAYAYGNSPQLYYPGYRSTYYGRPLTVFEPWPYVPGDIWGDFYTPPLRQPVAQAQTQTGPNRWESHPVYDPPLDAYPVLPPVNAPSLARTPYATERPAVPAKSAPAPTPRPSAAKIPADEAPTPGPSIDDAPARPSRREF
jgi:hypothetical protein